MNKVTHILFLLTPKAFVAYLDDTMSIRQALEKMRAHGFTAIPLISESTGEYLGTISEGDILWYIVNHGEFNMHQCENVSILTVLRKEFTPAVKVDTSIDDLLKMVMVQNFVPVVDDRNILMGIVTRRSVLKTLLKD